MTEIPRVSALLFAAGALFGFAGVGFAAIAGHLTDEPFVKAASEILLAQGPALIGVAALDAFLGGARGLRVAALVMIAGSLLFGGNAVSLLARGETLFYSAAPYGGYAILIGWLLLVAAGLALALRRR